MRDDAGRQDHLHDLRDEPIEILTMTAAIYVLFVFLVSQSGKMLADWLRRR